METDETCTSTVLSDPPVGSDLWSTCPLGDPGAAPWCHMPHWFVQPEVWGGCRLD